MSASFNLHPAIGRNLKPGLLDGLSPLQTDLLTATLAGENVVATLPLDDATTALHSALMLASRTLSVGQGQTLLIVPTPTLALLLAEALTNTAGSHLTCAAHTAETPADFSAQVLVATPEPLCDALQDQSYAPSSLQALAFYRADVLAGHELEADLQYLLETLPAAQQTLFIGEHLPDLLTPALESRCPNAHLINADDEEDADSDPEATPADAAADSQATESATSQQQNIAYSVPSHLKLRLLRQIITQEQPPQVIVFVEGRYRAERVVRQLNNKKYSALAIHSGLNRTQQDRTIAAFQQGKHQALVVTVRALRWIKLPPIVYLVNLALPTRAGDYLRQARRVRPDGTIINLVSPEEDQLLQEIEGELGQPMPRQTLENFDYTEAEQQGESAAAEPTVAKTQRNDTVTAEIPDDDDGDADEETPATWRSRSELRQQEVPKIPLEEYELPPMPPIWNRAGRFSNVSNKPRFAPEKYMPPGSAPAAAAAEGEGSNKRNNNRRRRRRGRGKGGNNPQGSKGRNNPAS